MDVESLRQKLAGIYRLTADRINQLTQDRSQAEGGNVPNARRSLPQQKRDRRRAAQEVLLQAEAANEPLISCTEGTLSALGYRKHHRCEWRLKQGETGFHQLWTEVNDMDKPRENLGTVHFSGPADNDAAAIDLFTRARAGDAESMARVRELLKDRKSLEWLNQLGKLSTQRLLTYVPDRDSRWKALLESHVQELYTEMLGENPSILEQLLVRRVINDWIAVNALELEVANKNPLDYTSRANLEKAMTLAHKRYTQAINELMRVRRLQETRLLAQITSVTRVTTRNSTNATAKEVGPGNEV
jgi:hypothetical protein